MVIVSKRTGAQRYTHVRKSAITKMVWINVRSDMSAGRWGERGGTVKLTALYVLEWLNTSAAP